MNHGVATCLDPASARAPGFCLGHLTKQGSLPDERIRYPDFMTTDHANGITYWEYIALVLAVTMSIRRYT